VTKRGLWTPERNALVVSHWETGRSTHAIADEINAKTRGPPVNARQLRNQACRLGQHRPDGHMAAVAALATRARLARLAAAMRGPAPGIPAPYPRRS
jgi:hypothetical protein